MADEKQERLVLTSSGTCRYHGDRQAAAVCSKFRHGYCAECLSTCTALCSDPKLYCRHRTACMIWQECRKESLSKSRASDPPDVTPR